MIALTNQLTNNLQKKLTLVLTSRPLLALLLVLARDPLLRATATAVIRTSYGHEFARQSMKDALTVAVGGRLSDATLDKVVRNASSSWTQSGHFQGRGRKTRHKVEATPAATSFPCLTTRPTVSLSSE